MDAGEDGGSTEKVLRELEALVCYSCELGLIMMLMSVLLFIKHFAGGPLQKDSGDKLVKRGIPVGVVFGA